MAQFRGTIQGARGSASRLGHKSTGLRVSCNGWHGGVTVQAEHLPEVPGQKDGEDRFYIYATGGSSAGGPSTLLGYVDGRGTFHKEARRA